MPNFMFGLYITQTIKKGLVCVCVFETNLTWENAYKFFNSHYKNQKLFYLWYIYIYIEMVSLFSLFRQQFPIKLRFFSLIFPIKQDLHYTHTKRICPFFFLFIFKNTYCIKYIICLEQKKGGSPRFGWRDGKEREDWLIVGVCIFIGQKYKRKVPSFTFYSLT